MRIHEITSRYRNDFHFVEKCEHCGHEQKRGDGYADEFYCLKVVPEGHFCEKCGVNTYGWTEEEMQAQYAAQRDGIQKAGG